MFLPLEQKRGVQNTRRPGMLQKPYAFPGGTRRKAICGTFSDEAKVDLNEVQSLNGRHAFHKPGGKRGLGGNCPLHVKKDVRGMAGGPSSSHDHASRTRCQGGMATRVDRGRRRNTMYDATMQVHARLVHRTKRLRSRAKRHANSEILSTMGKLSRVDVLGVGGFCQKRPKESDGTRNEKKRFGRNTF